MTRKTLNTADMTPSTPERTSPSNSRRLGRPFLPPTTPRHQLLRQFSRRNSSASLPRSQAGSQGSFQSPHSATSTRERPPPASPLPPLSQSQMETHQFILARAREIAEAQKKKGAKLKMEKEARLKREERESEEKIRRARKRLLRWMKRMQKARRERREREGGRESIQVRVTEGGIETFSWVD